VAAPPGASVAIVPVVLSPQFDAVPQSLPPAPFQVKMSGIM